MGFLFAFVCTHKQGLICNEFIPCFENEDSTSTCLVFAVGQNQGTKIGIRSCLEKELAKEREQRRTARSQEKLRMAKFAKREKHKTEAILKFFAIKKSEELKKFTNLSVLSMSFSEYFLKRYFFLQHLKRPKIGKTIFLK